MPTSDEQRAAQEARDAELSQADLASGQLPLQAQRRLAQETGAKPLFVTGLSVDEFLLTKSDGYDAVGQVMGSSIYHVGLQYVNYIRGELMTITRAHMQARHLAMARLEQEAKALGAHAVIGVRLTTRSYEWGPDLLEFTAIGTAIRIAGVPPPEQPVLSDLSGEDFWTLLRAGYAPRGLAMGFSSYAIWGSSGMYGFRNQELTDFSAGVYQARSLAMQRLGQDIGQLGASGVVGVKIDVQRSQIPVQSGSICLRIDFFVLGTAVVENASREPLPRPVPVLNMTGVRPMRTPPEAGVER
jgi:uncharacterized protein YbjQ (UPF0145 family)